jgi:DNA recombination protein RmuC
MHEILFVLGGMPVTAGAALLCLGTLVLAAMLVLIVIVARAARRRDREAEEQVREAQARQDRFDERMGEVARTQAETAGKLQMMGEMLAGRQAELSRTVGERLEVTTKYTVESLRALHERLAVIDNAHKNLTDLTTQVTVLRDVLANKQSRGAFGQARMEAIVQDGLPKGAFAFQHTLSNKTRPDCVVFLPDDRPLVIDAKFPLEAFTALRDARSDEEKKFAAQRLRQDMGKHIADIADKYLIPGETQEMALMFVPSESVYAEIHDGFDDIIQKAYRARIVLVSPSLLMLAIQVMQQILKDARMREAADSIRTEVGHMQDDLGRLRERVVKLQQHFGQANEDIRQILISADKIDKRATKIEDLDFDTPVTEPMELMPSPLTRKLQAGE